MAKAGGFRSQAGAVVAGLVLMAVGAGCQGDDAYSPTPRPPVERTISGVISGNEVRLSPPRIGGGLTSILIANLTDYNVRVTLEGSDIIQRFDPVPPDGTARLRTELTRGAYSLRVTTPA